MLNLDESPRQKRATRRSKACSSGRSSATRCWCFEEDSHTTCDALPLYLERTLARGVYPKLDRVEYLNAESGAVRVGDILILGRKRFELIRFTRAGEAVLLGPALLAFPMNGIPHDRGTPILNRRAVERAQKSKLSTSRWWE